TYEDHAKAHVGRSVHLVVGDTAALADELEGRRHLPRAAIEAGAQTFGQAARQIAEDATAGNVRGTLPTHRVELLQIRPVRLEQDFAQRLAQLREHPLQRNVFENLAHQRKAMRVEAARGEADEDVALADAARFRTLSRLDMDTLED